MVYATSMMWTHYDDLFQFGRIIAYSIFVHRFLHSIKVMSFVNFGWVQIFKVIYLKYYIVFKLDKQITSQNIYILILYQKITWIMCFDFNYAICNVSFFFSLILFLCLLSKNKYQKYKPQNSKENKLYENTPLINEANTYWTSREIKQILSLSMQSPN